MALDTYSGLAAALQAWATRSYSVAQIDEFFRLAEASISRRLGAQYRREVSAIITTTEAGEATLPSDFVGMRSVVRNTTGATPLLSTSWGALVSLNPYAASGNPTHYAIQGTMLKVAPVVQADFSIVYWARLAALGNDNTSNWLTEAAPDVYLCYLRAAQAAFEEEFDKAAAFESKGAAAIDELLEQSMLTQHGRGGLVLSGPTP